MLQIWLISLIFSFKKQFLGLLDIFQGILSSIHYQCQLVLDNSEKKIMKKFQ